MSIKLKNENLQVIGQVGVYFAGIQGEIMDVYYHIAEKYQKQGYATEATVPFIRELFNHIFIVHFLYIFIKFFRDKIKPNYLHKILVTKSNFNSF